MEIKFQGKYWEDGKQKEFSNLTQEELLEKVDDDIDNIENLIISIKLDGRHNIFDVRQNWSNCGILDIRNFFAGSSGRYDEPYTEQQIKGLVSTIEQLTPDFDLTGNFLMGTINEDQKIEIGDDFEKCGWNITELFTNDNGGNVCYLITKKLFEE
jgi:hypothetical protein